jgi:pimeloyl-ACP methyl ester carboxylesterase
MTELTHRFATANGIRMHFVEVGTGPLVIMCHGHPECWYSWRHQLPALAAAGYRAVALDLRGYGRTDNPKEVEAYSVLQVSGDLVGLVDALGEKKAVVVGHDLGAGLAQCAGLFRPDLFTAIALLSVPFVPRAKESPSQWEQRMYPGKVFYQQRYREPGFERVLDADPRAVILNGLYALSAEAHWSPARDQ